MKRIVVLSIFCGLFIIFNSCSNSRFNVIKVSSNLQEVKNGGVYYALPRTFIKVEVSISKTEAIKGPYSEFAGKYLGLDNVINQNAYSYELTGFNITSDNEPDPDQFYYIEIPDKSTKCFSNLLLSLTESGIIQNTSGVIENSTPLISNYNNEEGINVYPDIFKYYAGLNLCEQIDTIIEKVNLDTVTIEKKTLKRTLVEKTPEQKAKDAADFILKIKDNRFNLLSGLQEVNYDKETFKYMNEELEKLENEYKKLFTGLTFTKTIKYTYIIYPSSNELKDSIPLFKFSKLKGIIDTSSVYGDIVFLKLKKSTNTQLVEAFEKIRNIEQKKQHGLYYRIPEYADVQIIQNQNSRLSGKFLISQYGVISYLPPQNIKINFYEKLGSIKSTK